MPAIRSRRLRVRVRPSRKSLERSEAERAPSGAYPLCSETMTIDGLMASILWKAAERQVMHDGSGIWMSATGQEDLVMNVSRQSRSCAIRSSAGRHCCACESPMRTTLRPPDGPTEQVLTAEPEPPWWHLVAASGRSNGAESGGSRRGGIRRRSWVSPSGVSSPLESSCQSSLPSPSVFGSPGSVS